MNIGKRNIRQLFKVITAKQHYLAFFNIFRFCPHPFDVFIRYFLAKGLYPYSIKIKTPLGVISPTIYSYYDILTINEIFFRLDYKVNNTAKIIVDFGSNIGISALYFLTRNQKSKAYLFEPVPENLEKLRNNLFEFKDRYFLEDVAVSNDGGLKRFGTEEYGRCGGLLRETGNYINVKCVSVNEVLEDILNKEKQIDVLKIDTEGNELDIIYSIEKKFLVKIKTIFFEVDYTSTLNTKQKILPDFYRQFRYGNTIKLILKSFS
ncbi:MAG: FkbM family methyltransferase [Parcubacteria group bacterium]